MGRSRNVYTTSTILTASYLFTRRKRFYSGLMSPATVKTFLGLHVRCPIFLPDFNQIWVFSTDSYTFFSQYQIPRKSVRRERCRQTDGHDEGNRRFSGLCERPQTLREKRSLQPCRMTVGKMLICPHTHTWWGVIYCKLPFS